MNILWVITAVNIQFDHLALIQNFRGTSFIPQDIRIVSKFTFMIVSYREQRVPTKPCDRRLQTLWVHLRTLRRRSRRPSPHSTASARNACFLCQITLKIKVNIVSRKNIKFGVVMNVYCFSPQGRGLPCKKDRVLARISKPGFGIS